MSNISKNPIGSYSLGRSTPRRPWWLWPLLALLALLLLALLLWALLRGNDDDTNGTTAAAPTISTATSPPAPTTSTNTGTTTAAAAVGQLLVGATLVLPMSASGSLSAFAGQSVTANQVLVESVPADEGFWLGTSTTDRVWVALTGTGGESNVTIKQGDRVSFTSGTLIATSSSYPTQVGVSDAEGAAQLAAQSQHISVAKNSVQVSS